MKTTTKRIWLTCLVLLSAVFIAFGAGFAVKKANADETVKENVEITVLGGAWQNTSGGRYLIWLNDGATDWSKLSGNPEMFVDIDGTVKNVETYLSGKDLAIVVYEAEAPKASTVTITIKAGTDIGGVYSIVKDAVIVCFNGSFELKLSKEQKDVGFTFDSQSQAQDEKERYCIYVEVTETLTKASRGEFTCVIDENTENEKTVPAGYWAIDDGGTGMILLVDYKDITDGATASGEIGKHSITFKAGSIMTAGTSLEYVLAKEFVVWVGNESVYETEDEMPDLPSGYVKATKGAENKTVEINSVKIEDYVATAPVVKIKAGAEKDVDGNIGFTAGDPSGIGYCQSLKIAGAKAEPQIEFRSCYAGGDVYLVFEIRSVYDNGNYWLTDGAPMVRVRYSEHNAKLTNEKGESAGAECLWFDYFYNGLQGSMAYVSYKSDEFTFDDGEFFVKFGAINRKDRQGRDGFVFFVEITQNEKVAYAECMMSGDYNVSEDGDVTIYQAPFLTARLDKNVKEEGNDNEVANLTIMSVDKQREVDGKMTNVGVMSFYSPQIRIAEGYDEYDISDLVPIGKSITYAKADDADEQSQSMINAVGVSSKNGGYTVGMKIRFGGDDFGCTFAFRGKNTNAKSGYKLIIADDVVIIGSMTVASPFVKDTDYEIEIGCVDYFIADERVSSGAVVWLKVNGEKIVEDNINKISGSGTYFCGLVEGANESSVTISSVKTTGVKEMKVTVSANKTVLAKDKKATLSYESNMNTAFDAVEYEVVKGKARISGNGVYGESDAEIVVRAKLTNEYGTFYSDEFVFNEGVKEKKKGCNGSVTVAGALVLIAAMPFVIRRKKNEN